jgi:prepilin-type N-terminal cleavage/methylation domain-containing protein
MTTSRRARQLDDGFTLVELLVATFVLLVGVLGALTLLTGALRTTAANNERVGATNLARELVEGTRSLDYDDLTGALVQTRLQARGLGSGSPWTIQRRATTYTITATSCTYDDPADKLAATPPAGVCTPQPAGVSGDSNGEDFRRTTFRVAWRETGNAQRAVTQTTLIVNPSGGLGPRITGFTPVAQTVDPSHPFVPIVWTTTPATTLRWSADDGASNGSSTGSTSFTTVWDMGAVGSGHEVFDGAYEISAQAFDDRDIAGEARRANVLINRRQPYAPQSLAGGHDTRVDDWVDLQWSLNAERDILGYRVMWAGPDKIAGNSDDTQVCPAPAVGSLLEKTVTSCADRSPPTGATAYFIVAFDRAPDNQLRDGDRRTLSIGAAGSRPQRPGGPLVAQTVDSQPKLTWDPPSGGGSPSFFRIYRDGSAVGYADRYGRTTGNTRQFTDDSPGFGGHTYWVTAVDDSFNESDPLGPVSWSP